MIIDNLARTNIESNLLVYSSMFLKQFCSVPRVEWWIYLLYKMI